MNKKIKIIDCFAGVATFSNALDELKSNVEKTINEWNFYCLIAYGKIKNFVLPYYYYEWQDRTQCVEFLVSKGVSLDGKRRATAKELSKCAIDDLRYCYAIIEKYNVICDIYDLTTEQLENLDFAFAGFPCQDLSIAGLRAGLNGKRSGLIWTLLNTLEDVQNKPKYIILENVVAITHKNNSDGFKALLRALDELGYGCSYTILSPKDCGIPQERKRIFIVAKLNGCIDLTPIKQDFEPLQPIENFIDFDDYTGATSAPLVAFKGNKCVNDTRVATCLTTRIGRNHCGGYVSLQNGQKRFLKPKEFVLLQGYSVDDYDNIKDMKKEQIYKIFGNAICLKVAKKLIDFILNNS